MHLSTEYCNYMIFAPAHAKAFLKNYGPLLTWKTDKEIIADVGCANGEITTEILLPFCEKNVDKIIGIDISKAMLELANKNSKTSAVSFLELDVANKNLSPDMFEKFDHIFSFYCLHWIHDQRQCAENLYKMLKPGGEAFLTIMFRNSFIQSWFILSRCEKWSKYIGNFPKNCSQYFTHDEPQKLFETVFKDAGFAIKFIEVVHMNTTYTEEKLKQAIVAVNVPIDLIPEALREDYLKDNNEIFYKLTNDTCEIKRQVIVAIVKKPSS